MNGENLIGSVINERYELEEVIGSGGMSIVFKASDRLLNRAVAVKILKTSLKDDTEIVEKFSAEGKAAAALSHNNIVSVYDVGQIDGLSFIVMEFVDGQTLKEYINENKPVKWQTACEFAVQIANALTAAHEHGIIHRDIKPHNILIAKDGTVKVADFGIASAVSSDTVVAGGSALGSVHYISPEQARGGYVDNTSDLYSLGVVLYEMLTGALPFDGDNAVSIALKKLEEEPISPKVINLDIPQTLDAVVMKTISKEQHIRYKTAEEFANDIKALLNEDRMHIISTHKKDYEDEYQGSRSKKSISFNPIIATAIIILVIAVSVFSVMRGGSKEYIVPNLINKTLEEALMMLEDTEFTIDMNGILYEVSEEFEEGKIMIQNPGANQSVKKNKKIQLTISSGETEGNISVPKVLDLDYLEAKEILESKGLKCQMIEESSSEHELNQVMNQSPKNGTKVTEGYVVILHVCTSIENEYVKVPNLLGMTRAEAEQALKDAGLGIGNTRKEQSDKDPGTIISQSPKANSEVSKNSTVEIVIADNSQSTQDTPDTPAPNQPDTPPVENPGQQTEPPMQKKYLTINFPESAGDTIHIKVLANGNEFYNKTHQKSEGKVDILVQARKDTEIEVYMNDELVVRKIIEFN